VTLKRLVHFFLIVALFQAPITIADMLKAEVAYDSEDYEVAFQEYEKHAREGNPEAQAKLGIMYFWGRGTRRSESEAYAWSLKAAKQGHKQAQHTLAYMYETGIYIQKDIRKAIEWYQQAANQNYAAAQANLAGIYIYGEEIPKEVDRGFRLAHKAAEQQNNHAEFLVAYVYHHEKDDLRLAIQWYERAAKNGNAAAANQLGVLYFNGRVVEKDFHKAYFWFRIAEQNDSADGFNNRARAEDLIEMDDLKKLEEDIAKWFDDIKKAKEKAEKEKKDAEKSILEKLKANL